MLFTSYRGRVTSMLQIAIPDFTMGFDNIVASGWKADTDINVTADIVTSFFNGDLSLEAAICEVRTMANMEMILTEEF